MSSLDGRLFTIRGLFNPQTYPQESRSNDTWLSLPAQDKQELMALTPMMEAYSQLLAGGINESDAYRQAGYGGESSPTTINTDASRLAQHPQIVPRVAELRERKLALTDWDAAKTVLEASENLKQAREQ